MKSVLGNKLTFVVLGRSGAGKGTQARMIVERLRPWGVLHCETGRFLRELLEKENPTIRIARSVMMAGKLSPAWLAAYTWLRELIQGGHADKYLVFDGAPRRLWEARLIDEVMSWHGRPLPLCVLVDVSRREATRRLLMRGRVDDTPTRVRRRMEYYPRDVVPVIGYFRRHGRLVRVNGEQEVEAVSRDLDEALSRRLGKRWPRKYAER